jgi:hypothetical protein
MRGLRGSTLAAALACALGVVPATAAAADIVNQTYSGSLPGSTSGTLANQGTALELALTLPSAGDFTAFTTSYASGGFQPNLTLYDASGKYVTSQWATPPPGAMADPTTGGTLDGYLSAMGLQAGMYTLTLTDWALGQSITATNLSDGFTSNLGNGTAFVDVMGATRTGAYALTLDFTGPSSAVPEPASWLLTGPLLAAGIYFRRKWYLAR